MAISIKGIDGIALPDLNAEVAQGGRFVQYQYAISIIVMTFRRGSDIYFVRSHESAVVKGLPFTVLTLVLGWWGIPWGPIYTIQSLYKNLTGGADLTDAVLADLAAQGAR